MHEMSLAEGILDLVEQQAARDGFARVREIHLTIGALAGVEVSSLEFCLDAVCRGTLADGAAIVSERLPGKGWCLACSQPVEISARFDACPACGAYQVQVTGGDEMRVASLLVD
ncbi:hydrogenase maturation nickel metallochaperone HypA [Crenobacter caeni]|uniref:Hydrogenase maturation factor HypA n=1 Tax=Crenobacter caeni TaxID=2705474 RepID=A0A6B2KVE9_9NEIS|nr:hydrogenase maturation nickel metallochaperone HypA [Crenobacter caeni]NDV13979.1 hydrogenase maturation nickel metallochaperone HypA [Crenobacter caeni]